MDKMNQEKIEILDILIKQRESIEKLKQASKSQSKREFDEFTQRQVVYQDRRNLRMNINESLKLDPSLLIGDGVKVDKSDSSISIKKHNTNSSSNAIIQENKNLLKPN